jgi:hypothetical protein
VADLTPYAPDEVVLHMDVLPHVDHDDRVSVVRTVDWAGGHHSAAFTVSLPVLTDCPHEMADYLGQAVYRNRNRVLYVVACGRCPHMEVRPQPIDPRRKYGR